MLPQIEGLLILQDRDRRLRSLIEQLERIPAEEARAHARLNQDSAAVEHARQNMRENEVAIKKVELDAETRRTTITRLRNQQFETRKNEEFQALSHEVDRYAAEIDQLETRELELMEKADGLRARLETEEAALAKTRRLIEEDLAAIATRRETLGAGIKELREERAGLAAGVEESLLTLYERLLANKNGLAVASVKAGQCGGCHVRLIASTLIKVQSQTAITQCETCARILYPED